MTSSDSTAPFGLPGRFTIIDSPRITTAARRDRPLRLFLTLVSHVFRETGERAFQQPLA